MNSRTTRRAMQWLCFLGLTAIINLLSCKSQAQGLKLMLPIGHTEMITCVAYSPNGKYVATGSLDKTVKIWDIQTGTLLLSLEGHKRPVQRLSYNSTGTKLLTSSAMDDGQSDCKLWDAATGALYPAVSDGIEGDNAKYSPDGKRILTSGRGNYRLWDASSGKALLKLDCGYSMKKTESMIAVASPTATYSPDGTSILTCTLDSKLWNASSGTLIRKFEVNEKDVYSRGIAAFSPDGKKLAIAYSDKTVRVWDIARGTILLKLRESEGTLAYSPDGQKLSTGSKVWNAVTGALLFQTPSIEIIGYVAGGKQLLTVSNKFQLQAWNVATGKLMSWTAAHQIEPAFQEAFIPTLSPNHQKLHLVVGNAIQVWEVATGALVQTTSLKGRSRLSQASIFSPDGQRVATALDSTIRIWNATTGRQILTIHNKTVWAGQGYGAGLLTLDYSPDGQRLVTTSQDDIVAQVWDANTGALLLTLTGHQEHVRTAKFSADGKRIVTAAWDGTAKVWDAANGRLLLDLKGHPNLVLGAVFSPNGEKIITTSTSTMARKPEQVVRAGASVNVWDARKGKLLLEIVDPDGGYQSVNALAISPNGKYLLTSSRANSIGVRDFSGEKKPYYTGYANVWDVASGQLLQQLVDDAVMNELKTTDTSLKTIGDLERAAKAIQPASETSEVAYSPDGRRSVTIASDNTTKVWDTSTGELQQVYKARSGYLVSVTFSPDSRRLLISHSDVVEIVDLDRKELLYQYVPVQESDFLAIDQSSRYDGTPAARDLLYFTCGLEVITLNQVKEQLWVPNLTSRLVRSETINAKTLAELHLCGLVPEVKSSKGSQGYNYQIKPRQGGLGETVLSVNGIEIKRQQPEQLKKTATGYELAVSRAELQSYFVAGKANTVTVKAYTKNDHIASRGADVIDNGTATSTARPNLYAVMVGVSDYKGDGLDLNYAAKDAQDLAGALGSSARKLLNTDGQQHVFLYNLTTSNRDRLPEKISIRQTFEEIGRKATANDIIVVFLAGHGVVNEQNKKFYFLTADASNITATNAVAEVGISTQELVQWMHPSRIKAQKRVLILDACNSGQAIKDATVNGLGISARADDQAQQAKAIDRLNEQAGVFILAASASNQRAYEMSGYAQGLLTYALLEALKNHADILEDQRYLNVGRWFDVAKQTVSDIAQQIGQQQQSQMYSTTNFIVGAVDAEVLAGIVLPQQKVLFSTSNIQNQDENIATDDLGLSALLDAELHSLAARGATPDLAFADNTASPNAYRLTGRYEVKGEQIRVRIDIRKGNESLTRFEEKATRNNLSSLAAAIAARASTWVAGHK